MSKLVKCDRWEPEDMAIAIEALRNGCIGLNAASCACPLRKKYLKRH
jgi:hypothetical protein